MKTNNNFHILIVDDEKFNIELAAVYLKEEGYKLSFALNAQAAIESVIKKEISLILLDINMPQKDGFAVCKILKEDKKTKDIPVIFLTAQTDIEYISRAFEVGGVDYISKPFNGVELKARVKTHLQNVSYLEEIKDKQSKLAQLSITDPLTKLHNALYFDSQIKHYLNQEKKFWFIYMKIDKFDKINQMYGYYAANKLIKKFANLLESVSSSNVVIARLYGTGFGVLSKNYDVKIIKKLYEDIQLTLLKDKEIGKIITITTVLYNVGDVSMPLPTIYKNIQTSIAKIDERGVEKYLFIK